MPTPRWDPKGGLFFHRLSPSGQKQTTDFIARHPAAKNRPPIASPVTQRSKTDRRFHRWHPAVKNRPPFSSLAPSGQKQTAVFIAGTQRPKTGRRFHHFWLSGQKQTAVFTTFVPAVKNRPPFSQLLAQRSKTDRRFHNFWLSDQNGATLDRERCAGSRFFTPSTSLSDTGFASFQLILTLTRRTTDIFTGFRRGRGARLAHPALPTPLK